MSITYKQTGKKNNRRINKQETYPFFISNEVIDFWESVWIFFNFLRYRKYSF